MTARKGKTFHHVIRSTLTDTPCTILGLVDGMVIFFEDGRLRVVENNPKGTGEAVSATVNLSPFVLRKLAKLMTSNADIGAGG